MKLIPAGPERHHPLRSEVSSGLTPSGRFRQGLQKSFIGTISTFAVDLCPMTSLSSPPVHLPEDVYQTLVEAWKNMDASRYTCAGGLVVMFYDWMITFDEEMELIWRMRIGSTSILFLINRYLSMPFLLMYNYHIAGLRGDVSDNVSDPLSESLFVIPDITVLSSRSDHQCDSMGHFSRNLNLATIASCHLSLESPQARHLFHLCLVRFIARPDVDTHGYCHAQYLPDGYVWYGVVLNLRLMTCLVWAVAPGSLWYMASMLEFAMTVALASRFHLHLKRAVRFRDYAASRELPPRSDLTQPPLPFCGRTTVKQPSFDQELDSPSSPSGIKHYSLSRPMDRSTLCFNARRSTELEAEAVELATFDSFERGNKGQKGL
ncbi:hypothetical protein PIIN_00142 [Serendipita indica DSM 11827]|uniref:DUF6533 domain-containing protein n=1 Tax=Serendipita indica (strain DSM 11827) TaxID=1109443 RepID=G4T594_SERID|nr:hypothetical protein PIIN_00142 [Serendipita indica DSM 11827]